MKRRFGRRRRSGGGDDGSSAIDPSWLQKIVEAGLVPVQSLEPVRDEAVPAGLALLARGVDAEGRSVLVSFSPRDAGDALIGLVAHRRGHTGAPPAQADPEAGADPGAQASRGDPGRAYVVSRWSAAARRKLALIGQLDVELEPVEAGRLLEGPDVQPEPAPTPCALPPRQVGLGLAEPIARELFERALASLAGLAAKHAGGVRGTESGVELVLVAKRVARLVVRDAAVFLESFESRTGPQKLALTTLAEAFDQLEGQLRKRVRDARGGRTEESLRAATQVVLPAALGLRTVVPFPLGGSDSEVIDVVGVAEDGRVVVAVVRERLGLAHVGAILDAWCTLQPSLPGLLASALPPVRLDRPPRLVVTARESDPAAVRVLEGLTLELVRLDVRSGRDGLPELVPAGTAPAKAPAVGDGRERGGRRRGRGRRGPRRRTGREGEGADALEGDDAPRGPRGLEARAPSEADSEGGTGGSGSDERDAGDDDESGDEAPRFASLSSFDLDDSFGLGLNEGGGGRGRRSRSRQRGRRRDGTPEDDDEAEAAQAPRAEAADAEIAADDPAETEAADEDVTADEEDLALAEAPEPEEELAPVRQERPRKVALLAHADRHSLAAAMLLAREARQVEGIWVYPQSELMTFFRSVTTDLRDDVTIIVVGFQASPARDALQAASLYAGRIEWYDVHAWPPEDVAALKASLGDDFVDVHAGLESPMPLMLPRCTRRSRFSDKLVDLVAARFTEHDFQRWGGLWWSRLGEIASRPGDHKNELQPLLTGRPSDLARDASRAEAPPPPSEVEFVGSRDFRIVHFGGYGMVILEVPRELDLSMAGRIARERYGAQLSMARRQGDGLVILGANDALTPRPLAVGRMAEHLGEKLAWVETLPGADHVARFRIHGVDAHPERVEAVVAEVGMGRAILEG